MITFYTNGASNITFVLIYFFFKTSCIICIIDPRIKIEIICLTEHDRSYMIHNACEETRYVSITVTTNEDLIVI